MIAVEQKKHSHTSVYDVLFQVYFHYKSIERLFYFITISIYMSIATSHFSSELD